MRKEVSGQAPNEEEFHLLGLPKSGITLESYATQEALMLNLEKQMNLVANNENFKKAMELQIGVNEIQMWNTDVFGTS